MCLFSAMGCEIRDRVGPLTFPRCRDGKKRGSGFPLEQQRQKRHKSPLQLLGLETRRSGQLCQTGWESNLLKHHHLLFSLLSSVLLLFRGLFVVLRHGLATYPCLALYLPCLPEWLQTWGNSPVLASLCRVIDIVPLPSVFLRYDCSDVSLLGNLGFLSSAQRLCLMFYSDHLSQVMSSFHWCKRAVWKVCLPFRCEEK